MNYLFVVAHPDDEVLAAGGMIYNLIKKNNNIYVCFMCSNAEARKNITNNNIIEQAINSLKSLGVSKKNIIFGTYPNIKLNTIDHLSLVQFIEKAIQKFKPDVVITHYKSDINIDHKITSDCCDEAIRLFQRNDKEKEIKKYMYMEVLSATDWANNISFSPNYFYEIKKEGLNAKIKALSYYDGALRKYPHPRSTNTIEALATLRGSQAKLEYAEAFMTAFERETYE